MNRGTVRLVLNKDLNVRKVCDKMEPSNLNGEHRNGIKEIYSDLSVRLLEKHHLLLRTVSEFA